MFARLNWLFNPKFGPTALSRSVESAGRSSRWIVALLTISFFAWLYLHYIAAPAFLSQWPPIIRETLIIFEAAAMMTLIIVWALLFWSNRFLDALPASTPKMSVEQMYALSPIEFEEFVGQLFRQKGYAVQRRGASGDAGVDLELMQQSGKRAVVQCKRYRHTVGPDIVRELYGVLIHERVAHAFLVTTADISDAAREWARGKPMTLIDGDALAHITAVLPTINST